MYDISKMDSSYHRRNQHEEFHIQFQTDQPDGLLWYNGNDTNNAHLSIKVQLMVVFDSPLVNWFSFFDKNCTSLYSVTSTSFVLENTYKTDIRTITVLQ